jgi:aryl-alcohol dehydrogenase-like predicted oxidoreductase
MEYTSLGKTGLEVSVVGLGCGGHSKLGQLQGASIAESVRVVHEAIDLGINIVDTADTGGMEWIVGAAIHDRRDRVQVATKLHPSNKDSEITVDARKLRGYVEDALHRLRTDRIDIFYLHGVAPKEYDHCVAELLPELHHLRERGLIRFVGVTESWTFSGDTAHRMLSQAVRDDHWDVLMTAFNILNQTAVESVLQPALAKEIGVFVMYAVRDLLSRPKLLRAAVRAAIDEGVLDPKAIDADDPLGFLVQGGATSVVEAAYRFVRHTPGVSVVLTGTGNVEHLRANIASISRGPLPDTDIARLKSLFGGLTYFSGNAR